MEQMEKYNLKTLVIIPAYKEAKNLPRLFRELKEVPLDFDIVVINDCSPDDTEAVCRHHGIPVVSLPVNLGIGGAVQTGYKYALEHGYDIAVQMDGDGQHDPRFLKLVLSRIYEGYHMSIGSRFIEGKGYQSSLTRRAGIKFFSWLIKLLTGQYISDPTSGFRACSRELIRLFAGSYPKDYPEPETIVTALRNKYRIAEVPVIMRPRQSGESSITKNLAAYYMIKVTLAVIMAAIARKNEDGAK
ncbi:glycosyltransferase family 2 protein [Thermoclostridium caenicola]|uniref:Glycosyltransferase 2-like domain-containing protein n=1 Tax=Thermoclostridium caenicola TaxID=659425 RepID=A0A1M6DM66_9FIRM|nr:hypothetical protein SAMN05444373_100827 [Thermoclostridium caenicola]